MNGENRAQSVNREPRQAHRAWSLYIGSPFGIPIYLHFTFVLLLIFVGSTPAGRAYFGGLPLVIAIFASVALHELGHALMARRFGIKTDDIVLYPIGGVARLRSLGEGFQEFWIAIAGPLVNVAIAIVIYAVLRLSGQWQPLPLNALETEMQLGFWQKVLAVNLMLIAFNMIPAFPMDGGRVLRAILARKLPKERATRIAAKIGQALAILFMLAGIFSTHLFLMFIGFLVFIAAGQEAAATRSAALMAGKRARDAMITHFDTLAHGDSLGKAADLLLATSQQDFPVLGGGEVLGVLSRKALIQGLATHGRDHYVAEVMERDFLRLDLDTELRTVHERFHEHEGMPILIFDGDRLAGYINHENLMEYLLIQQAQNHH